MRVLVFHGYLLRGTGSNVYNARLCAALKRAGHIVDLLCQEPRPEELDFVDAVGTWEEGVARVQTLREPVRVTVWRPDIGRLLPVYVADRYEGFEARPLLECSDAEIEAYVQANVAAVRDVCARAAARRGARQPPRHGTGDRGPRARRRRALRGEGARQRPGVRRQARSGRASCPGHARASHGARGVLVGSRHTGESLFAAMQDDGLPGRTRLGPPGVDVDEFRPRDDAAAGVEALIGRLAASEDDAGEGAFARDASAAASALRRLDLVHDRHVCFIGKLIVSKGIDLLLAAWPLVPEARLVVIGFGGFHDGLVALLDALAAGDREAVRAIARAGRELEGGPRAPLRHLLAFLDTADEGYWAAARDLRERVVLTGRLEHDELAPLLAGCEALVFPSTFPEAYGMVAAEAAACGVLPVSAGHSGAAEVSAMLAAAVPAPARGWLTFAIDDGAVRAIAERVTAWLRAPDELRAATRAALVATARARFSWEGVAGGVIAAAQGDLAELPPVA